jgi:hypothetical protein
MQPGGDPVNYKHNTAAYAAVNSEIKDYICISLWVVLNITFFGRPWERATKE